MARRTLTTASLLLAGLALAPAARATPSLEEYRFFRSLSIDLNGRIPTRDEVAAFEQPGFDVAQWVDAHLTGPAYAERVRRIYMDLMRLQVTRTFVFRPQNATLRRITVRGPNNEQVPVYFRLGQRRERAETDGTFCLANAETGMQFPVNGQPSAMCNNPVPVSQETLDRYTVVVRPWWLYRDYRSANPTDRYDATWAQRFPGYAPVRALTTDPMGRPITEIRVCREEAQTNESGPLYVAGTRPPPTGTGCDARLTRVPADNAYVRMHAGEMASCSTPLGAGASLQCGCGAGLERCMPGTANQLEGPAFTLPSNPHLGFDEPLDETSQTPYDAARFWWSEEARHFLDYVFAEDRDFREVLSGRYSFVNGPLAQFYRTLVPMAFPTDVMAFGYATPQHLVEPAALPADLLPHDVSTWDRVEDRGPRAAGLLTMPIFLSKYGTRRARAHVLYNAFLCRDFVAGAVELSPSTEPNLMVRPGCATCHATLEPLAAYFSRVRESDWTFLPGANFPVQNPMCALRGTALSASCNGYYDPAFSSATQGMLRGAYGSTANADAGPQGLATHLAQAPEFGSCVADNLASSFLGRTLTAEDTPLRQQLTTAFTGGGFRVRALVRALVLSDAYRHSNNFSSTAWREGGGQ